MGIEFIEIKRDQQECLPNNLRTTLQFTVSQLHDQKKCGAFSSSASFYFANLQFKFTAIQPYRTENGLVLKTNLYMISGMKDNSNCLVNIKSVLLGHETLEEMDVDTLAKAKFSYIDRSVDIDLNLNEIDAEYIRKDEITVQVLFYADKDKNAYTLDILPFLEWHASDQKSKSDQIMALKKQLDYYKDYDKFINIFNQGVSLLKDKDCDKFEWQMEVDENRKVHLQMTPAETENDEILSLKQENKNLIDEVAGLKKLLLIEKLK